MRVIWLTMALLVACEAVPPSGAVFAPAAVERPASAAPAQPPLAVEEGEGFDFDADAAEQAAPPTVDAEDDPGALARAMGIYGLPPGDPSIPDLRRTPAPEPPPEPPPDTGTEPPTASAPAAWQPGRPLDGSWGVRLVSTVPDAQPPRAILGMPDGSEAVVQPGTLLPGASLVVLAIGRDVVQVAEIVPKGDHARVETRELRAMYGARPSDR